MNTNTLPKVPSELLALALSDLELVEKDDKYVINMGFWHTINHNKYIEEETPRCAVCMAGSVLAKTLNLDFTVNYDPAARAEAWECEVYAINSFRQGYIREGFVYLLRYDAWRSSGLPSEVPIVEYDDDPVEFKNGIRSIIQLLKEKGL